MKIIIAGGTGQVGTILCRAFSTAGDDVVVLTRRSTPSSLCRSVQWNAETLCAWTDELEDADVVINLAGKSVNCRYGATATIYAHRFDAPNDEFTSLIGGNEPDAPDTWSFSIDVAKAWESAVNEAALLPQTRTVIMRSAMTMSPDREGIFATLLALVRLGLGGRAGNGRQFVSWIHEYDFVQAIRFLIENEISGIVNVCSPNPLPNSEFMRDLRRAWGTKIGMPASKWMLEIGAFFMRTESELILKSRRVIPSRLLQNGFAFRFPNWRDAAADLCSSYRKIA